MYYCHEDTKHFYGIFSFSRILIKNCITCLSEGLISFALDRHFRHFPFVHVDLMSKVMEARVRKVFSFQVWEMSRMKDLLGISFYTLFEEGAKLASPPLALIFPLESGKN